MRKTIFTILLLSISAMSAWAYQKEKIYINSGGKQRNILVYTPDELPAGSPLFITTHGMGGNSENQAEHDRMYELVDTAKFVMVYPRADGDYWDISGTTDQNFIIKVIDEMATRYKIDRKRVYWSGFSMGSMLLFHCMPNMLDKIAAFAPTSGIQFSEEPWKKCAKKVNVMECIAYNDNAFTYNKYNIRGYMENMANMNRYTKYKKQSGYRTKNGTSWFDGDRELWLNEKTGHEVVLYSYNYSGKGSHTPVAENSYEIWNWCKRFTLNPDAPGNSTQEEAEVVHYDATAKNAWVATPTSGIPSGSDITFNGATVTIGAPDDAVTWAWHAGNQGLLPSQMPSTGGTIETLITSFSDTEPYGELPTHGAFLKIEPSTASKITISGKASANAAQPLVFVACQNNNPLSPESVKITPWDNDVTQWTYEVDANHVYYFFQQAYPGQLTAYRFTLRSISFECNVEASVTDLHYSRNQQNVIYGLDGIHRNDVQRGLNIVVTAGGSIKKILSR